MSDTKRDEKLKKLEEVVGSRFAEPKSDWIALFRKASERMESEHGEERELTAGLDAEDLRAELGDDDALLDAIDDLPAGVYLGLLLLAVARGDDLWEGVEGPYDLDLVHARFARRVLDELDRQRKRNRPMVRAVFSRDPLAARGRSSVEICYLVAMNRLYRRAESKKLVPGAKCPHDGPVELEGAHRMLFDLLGHLLHRWSTAGLLTTIFGRTPAQLYGDIVADAWRSRVLHDLADLSDHGQQDILGWLSIARPRYSPWTFGQAIRGVKELIHRIGNT